MGVQANGFPMSPTDPSQGPSTDDLIAQVFGDLAQDPTVLERARHLVQRVQAGGASTRAVPPPLPVSEAGRKGATAS